MRQYLHRLRNRRTSRTLWIRVRIDADLHSGIGSGRRRLRRRLGIGRIGFGESTQCGDPIIEIMPRIAGFKHRAGPRFPVFAILRLRGKHTGHYDRLALFE